MAEKRFEPRSSFTSKTLYSVFSCHLGSTTLPLPARSPGAYRGHAGSSRWMHIPTAPGSAAVLPTHCSRSWLSWHPPCPPAQTAVINISETHTNCWGLLPCPPLMAHLYSPRACHGAGSPACGSLTRLQRGEGAQGRGDLSPVPGALQVSGQWGAPAG